MYRFQYGHTHQFKLKSNAYPSAYPQVLKGTKNYTQGPSLEAMKISTHTFTNVNLSVQQICRPVVGVAHIAFALLSTKLSDSQAQVLLNPLVCITVVNLVDTNCGLPVS